MKHDQIHSIYFSKKSVVLFFEGPVITAKSLMLEPFVHEKRIPTGDIQDWMFLRESS